jgi:uncharacterized membrane protein YccC
VVDLISQCYQQMHMLAANQRNDYKRLLRVSRWGWIFRNIFPSACISREVQKLVERSHAEAVIRWNAQTVAARLRVLADDILYHRYPQRFTWINRSARWRKSPASIRITRSASSAPGTSAALPGCCAPSARYTRDLMADKKRLAAAPALKLSVVEIAACETPRASA